MRLSFTKYHGTGNDFIMIDDRNLNFPTDDHRLIENLCHRNFGIGADGLIIIQNHDDFDFMMRYFNADGYESTMCGNGGRCAVSFAAELDIVKGHETLFMAVDGIHQAEISADTIRLKMKDIRFINNIKDIFLIDSGSPHAVIFCNNVEQVNVLEEGGKIRYDKSISENGVNVNFIEKTGDFSFRIRTYERGVENETLSCGTGTIASAVAFSTFYKINDELQHFTVMTKGGELEVSLKKTKNIFTEIYLIGPAKKVFQGETII